MCDKNVSERIKTLIKASGLTIADAGRLLGTTDQNVHNKIRRNNWTVEDLENYSNALDGELSINIKLRNGEVFKIK